MRHDKTSGMVIYRPRLHATPKCNYQFAGEQVGVNQLCASGNEHVRDG
jgi:hypothetical protein